MRNIKISNNKIGLAKELIFHIKFGTFSAAKNVATVFDIAAFGDTVRVGKAE